MNYYHVDVFSEKSLSGNGLTVIFCQEEISCMQATSWMQTMAREFKQFETIFLQEIGEKKFRARIFTVEEELDFAGHPVIGATAAIHDSLFPDESSLEVIFELPGKNLQAESQKKNGHFRVMMNQGNPEFRGVVEGEIKETLLKNLNLTSVDLYKDLQMEVVSTGLPYLIVPIASGIEKAKICVDDLEEKLAEIGAKFVYILDVEAKEGRTWDNLGAVEDVATGSAAGPAGAWLFAKGLCPDMQEITINQGRFVGRPSKIQVQKDSMTGEIKVLGDVTILVKGQIV